MARDISDIQKDIERTRRQLATTLDELANRSHPKNLVSEAKTSASTKLKDPKAQAVAAGVAALIIGGIVLGVVRSRKKSKDLKAIQDLLASRR